MASAAVSCNGVSDCYVALVVVLGVLRDYV